MSVKNTQFGEAVIEEMMKKVKNLFFIGIGGISMASIALLARERGFSVRGSDRSRNSQTERLAESGITVFPTHEADHIAWADAVVFTVAIGEDNPEYTEAKAKKLPLFSRADFLGWLMMKFKHRIGFAGMHGKSTATGMAAEIFLRAEDPTVLCGAELPSLGRSTYRIGKETEHVLFEACEYMDSFLDFTPTAAVLLNVGMDHVDYFHSMEQIRNSFRRFAEKTQPGGTVLYREDDAELRKALSGFTGALFTFGLTEAADFCAEDLILENGTYSFTFCHEHKAIGRVCLSVPGLHSVLNALAAGGAALLAGISPEQVTEGLSSFKGVCRRMEKKGFLPSGSAVYDDYGHHPDEIRATLNGAKNLGYSRVLCAFQPHTYSRTAGLLQEFSEAFGDADRVFLADIYAAREINTTGVTSRTLADRIGEKARYTGGFEDTAHAILEEAGAGDLVVVMGAGDIEKTYAFLPLSHRD